MKHSLGCLLLVLPILTSAQGLKKVKSRFPEPSKYDFAFKISIPEGNYFYLNKGDHYGSPFGFLGLSAGFEYYLSDRYSINMDVGALMDFMFPFPAPVDVMGSYDKSSAFFADIQIGTDWGRFHVDAGFQYHKTSYVERETIELFPDYIDTLKYSKRQDNLGLAFSSYFRITKSFNVGINYYPSYIILKGHPHYAHLLFVDLIFRIKWR